MHQYIWRKQRAALGSLSLPLVEKLSFHCHGRRGLTTATTVVNEHIETPVPFTWKTSQLERKNHGPKPPKYSFTIIKYEYNKFFYREH
jgi:hypothetical protein